MVLDLGSLEESIGNSSKLADGSPLQLHLDDIEEDPDQPRTEFDVVHMDELVNSISERGVKTPISVRPHPTATGKWIINNGARRFRASRIARIDTIPAFIDEAFEDYDQVIVNDQHSTLTPMERAQFIAKKIAQGEKKGVIAKALSMDTASITHHLSLIDLPSTIEAVFRSGRCTSAKTLYELRNLHEQFGSAVDDWCATSDAVTRTTVNALGAALKSPLHLAEAVGDVADNGAAPTVCGWGAGSVGAPRSPVAKPESLVSAAKREKVAKLLQQLVGLQGLLEGHDQALNHLATATGALQQLQKVLTNSEEMTPVS